jgi:TolB protein
MAKKRNLGFYLLTGGMLLLANACILIFLLWRGNQIALRGDSGGGSPALYRMNLLAGNPRAVYPESISHPTWSPNGREIAFIHAAGEHGSKPYQIAVMDQRGKNFRILTEGHVRNYHPTWSPDGKKIAYIHAREYESGAPLALFVMNRDGSEKTQITPYGYYNYPDWSPDGAYFALISAPFGIYTMRSDGTELTQLTSGVGDFYPAWSPDGEYIAFNSDRAGPEGNLEIYLMRRDGTEIRRLTDHPGKDRHPNWSPDGKYILFESNRYGEDWTYHICLMKADGTGLQRLTELESTSPIWRP